MAPPEAIDTSTENSHVAGTPIISNQSLKSSSDISVTDPLPPSQLPVSDSFSSLEMQNEANVARFSPPDEYQHATWNRSRKAGQQALSLSDDDDVAADAQPSSWSERLRSLVNSWGSAPSTKRSLTSLMGTSDEQNALPGDGAIHGIPNFGQTCFCNAVLQSLASLDPMVAYLEHLGGFEQSFDTEPNQPSRTPWSQATQNEISINAMMSRLIQNVNGQTSVRSRRGIIDPRDLLQLVGQSHSQFAAATGRLVGREQQDAQEFLHALLGTLTAKHTAGTGFFRVLPSPFCMTDVGPLSQIHSLSLSDSCWSNENEEIFLGLKPGILIGMPLEDGLLDKQSTHSMSSTSALTNGDNDVVPRSQEEKKDEIERSSRISKLGVPVALPSLTLGPTPATYSTNSMRIMETTTSSLTPHPLSGWLASSIQCRVCHHVRPLQNTPFGDLALAPTSITGGLQSVNDTPSKIYGGRIPPPCRLEECLEQFTCVERVSEVECHNCSLRALRQQLEDDVEFYGGAHAVVSRKKSQQSDASCCLLDEFESSQSRLARVRRTSPDDTEQIEELLEEHARSKGDDWRVDRVDAFKCLLISRLPSILCIHIQRRHYDPMTNRMTKALQHVAFPEFLNVGPYCAYAGGYQADSAWTGTATRMNAMLQTTPAPVYYRLQSVIEHFGSAFGGHYQAYRRDSTGNWLFCSDDTVRSVHWDQVQRCQAYMLFYEAL